jgi:sugar phosphate isomerase/epimerase
MYFTGISDEAGGKVAQQIAAHKALGWQQLELRLIEGTNATLVDDATFDRALEAIEEAGMTICCFASALANWSRKISGDFARDVNELRQAIPRMQRSGTSFIRIMSFENDGLSDEAWRDEAVRRIRELATMAEDGGITLLHENCTGWGGESPENTLELLERVDSPALKLVFDTGNTFIHQQDAQDYLRKVIDHVVHVHIKDGYMSEDHKPIFTYPGEGSCRVEDSVRILLEHGYDGGYSIEPHIAAVVHTGDIGGEEREQLLFDSYLEYGRRFMALYERVAGARV